MRVLLAAVLLAVTPAVTAAENIMLVLDASGSMWGQVDGRSKVEIARETVAGVVRDWKPDNALGLIAYGHRRKGDCADIETLVPVGPLDATAYLRTVNGLNAIGMTPLSAAVQQAAKALRSTEQKATVILVSDGEETCKLDPCAVGAELEKSGVDFTAHVIGFDVTDIAKQAQLRCLASATGGRYFNARDARELGGALQGAIDASTEPPPPPAEATIAFDLPVVITQSVPVRWTGPADRGDFIALARPQQKDDEYVVYSRMLDTQVKAGAAVINAPAQAGQYEVRYVNPRRNTVLARSPVTVADVQASIDAPSTAAPGTRIKVVARGPFAPAHWVGFAPVGSAPNSYLHYARLSGAVSELELMVPAEPGAYELRFVLNEDDRILVSRPITVIASEVSVRGAASVMAGDRYPIEAMGPTDSRHWIGFAPAGSAPRDYRDYVRPSGPTTTAVLVAPHESGDYELRYVLNESESVAAMQPVTVTPVQATLQPTADALAGQRLRIGFKGPRGKGNWIGFVRSGTLDYLGYEDVPGEGEAVVEVMAPESPGAYELVFVVGDKAVTRMAITVR